MGMVENLNGNIPQGLTKAVSVRFADSPTMKAKKIQGCFAGGDEGFGKAKGKGKGKSSPYGKDGNGGGGKVQFGNLDPNLPAEVKSAVDSVLMNLGGKGRKMIAHEG